MSADRVRRLPGDPPSPYELSYGFSRLVVGGGLVLVGGTTSITEDGFVIGESPHDQTVEILRKLVHELSRAGVAAADVLQTRVYVTDISRADEVGRAHGEVFGSIRPLMTMVEVSGLIDPRMLVEIEAVALAPPTALTDLRAVAALGCSRRASAQIGAIGLTRAADPPIGPVSRPGHVRPSEYAIMWCPPL